MKCKKNKLIFSIRYNSRSYVLSIIEICSNKERRMKFMKNKQKKLLLLKLNKTKKNWEVKTLGCQCQCTLRPTANTSYAIASM